MQSFYGGTALRRNMARLDKQGYRVAYHSYTDFEKGDPSRIQSYDAVVLLDQRGIDWQNTGELRPATAAMFAEIRKLLASGGGLMAFTGPGEPYMKSMDPLLHPYGMHPVTGCLVDTQPVPALYGYTSFAYTREIIAHVLTKGVQGLWYPVGAKAGGRTHFDTLRNANFVPFDVDDGWTVLVSVRATSTFKPFGAEEGADTEWLQQPRMKAIRTPTPAVVAIREGAEGKGRIAVCGINGVYSDFVAGNDVFDGVCTGKGLDGKPSHLDRLLMNVLDWLGERSVAAGRDTVAGSDRKSFEVKPFRFADPKPVSDVRPLQPVADRFEGMIGARSAYSGGKSTVAEYAAAARELGLDYLAFLEDFSVLAPSDFAKLQQECESLSDEKLILIPGIRIQDELGIHFFGFKVGLELPQESFLKPGTRVFSKYPDLPGQYRWIVANGGRNGTACGNFRLEVKEPNGVPASDYNVQNPFVSLYTYRGGKLVDTMLDTYLKCAARTEWVSPIAIHLVDTAAELRAEWRSDHFKTTYLRDPGKGLDSFKDGIGDRFAFLSTSYVSNGPRIEQWRSTGHDCAGGWWDWTRLRRFVKLAVSSPAGLKEIRVLDGEREIRRFLPGGAKRFEHTMVLTYNEMDNNILIVTDNDGRQAISDEEWGKNQLFQLTWCADRNNMLSYAGLPAPKAASGNTGGNYPAPWNLEKGGFRECLTPAVNQDRSRMPHFDGQPMCVARVSPAPAVYAEQGVEGGTRIARDFGRRLCSPDGAIQWVECRRVYPRSIEKPHPWTRGPLVPMELFHADLTYTTFSHAGHLPAPVILEGKISFLKDVTFGKKQYPGVHVLSMSAWNRWGGYHTAVVQHSSSGNMVTRISYTDEPTTGKNGLFNRGAYIYFYPSVFGSVGVMSLCDGLSFRMSNKHASVGFDTRGRRFKAGDELTYRILVFVSGFDEPHSTRLPEALRDQLGMNGKGEVSYTVDAEQGAVADQEYMLTIDGRGGGFAGEIRLPARFPVSLPVVVENLNDRWTSVLYDRGAKKLRPLGMHDNSAYCHRPPPERGGRIFVGHPFTLDHPELWLSVVQTRERELTVQIHNPTARAVTTQVSRSPFFDFVTCKGFGVEVQAGATVERVVTGSEVK